MPAINKDIMVDMIYITLTAINLVLPLLFLALYTYLSIQFAGFPPSSHTAVKRMKTLEKISMLLLLFQCYNAVCLVLLWTLARTSWGFLALTTGTCLRLSRLMLGSSRGLLSWCKERSCHICSRTRADFLVNWNSSSVCGSAPEEHSGVGREAGGRSRWKCGSWIQTIGMYSAHKLHV